MSPNWVDFVLLLVFLGGFLSREEDTVKSFIKLIGIVFATVVTFHYYTHFGEFLYKVLDVKGVLNNLLSFFILSSFIILIFYLMCDGWKFILDIKIGRKVNSNVPKVLNVVRSVFLAGILLLGFIVSDIERVSVNARTCFLGGVIRAVSVGAYEMSYNVFLKPFFPDEPINQNLFDAIEGKKSDRWEKLKNKK